MTPCLGLSSQVSRWYHFLRWDIEREVSLDHHVSDVMGYCESSSGAGGVGKKGVTLRRGTLIKDTDLEVVTL